MSHAALTQRYRPQTFADVAGQATLKAILSRAAAEDRVAPAYLFSGTRGVGKTTIARIFAKALNCKQAHSADLPAGEPCNDCDNCRAITLGGSVDVVEIDGASNRGIDDVRRLKESVGYAPMDGRYKIFIIDEAHMLSREAFNALLKTLEEPPARVTFIMATTEAHKFPVTILSRCQHYVFKRLSDTELETHLCKILGLEHFPYEPAAIRLIVRRAAGSVRDAMSLLGQVLALGGDSLNEADTRMVLGLAGQELFFKLLSHIKDADCPSISLVVRDMLDQGLDLGFFLRELSSMWRNLFMLRQSGEAARGVVDLPEAEVERWLAEAKNFEITHIHAAWQMSLEGQRRVLTSLEPALALELLLLNLAMLPKLLSMEQVSMLSRKHGASEAEKKSPITEQPAPSRPAPAAGNPANRESHGFSATVESPVSTPAEPTGPSEKALPDPMHTGSPDDAKMPNPDAVLPDTDGNAREAVAAAKEPADPARAEAPDNHKQNASASTTTLATDSQPPAMARENAHGDSAQDEPLSTVIDAEHEYFSQAPAEYDLQTENSATDAAGAAEANGNGKGSDQEESKPEVVEGQGAEGDWSGLVRFCTDLAKLHKEIPVSLGPLLNKVEAEWANGTITITPPDLFSAGRLEDKENSSMLKSLVSRFCGCSAVIRLLPPPDREANKRQLRERLEEIPAIKALQENLGAQIIDYAPWRG